MAVWISFTGMAIMLRYQPATRGQSAHTVRLDNPTDHLSTISSFSTTISRHSRSALRTTMGTDHNLLLLSTNGLWSRGWQEGHSYHRWHLWVLPYEHYLIVEAWLNPLSFAIWSFPAPHKWLTDSSNSTTQLPLLSQKQNNARLGWCYLGIWRGYLWTSVVVAT